jgi:Skp family chaperone for outer membrane proteins
MMNLLRGLVVSLALISLTGGSALGQSKMATIDLRRVFDGYWKKRQAEAALKDRQTDMEKEDRNMVDDYKKVKEEYQSLLAGANDQAVSSDERDKRKNAAEEKLRRMKEMEDTIAQYERQARTTIGEQSQRMRSNILTEIRNVVNAKAKAGGFSLVIDTAAETINSTPVFLYSNNENDITEAVLQQLNATAPADALKTEEKTADADKKKDSKNK